MDDADLVATRPGAAPAADGFEPHDRYSLIERLGHGGMGTVWAAHDKVLDRTVALKVLHDEFLGAEDQARLVAEARAMARLSHRNVIDVYDVAEKDGRTYLTMELVRGISLDKWLETPRDWREIVAVFRPAAAGLAAAHAAGIVHRDVKPANILVSDDGEVRVADFGVAHASVSRPDAGAVPTAVTAGMIGTLAYMAPEQLRGQVADARSDQFAFFCSLYEALHRRRPFRGATVDDQLATIANGCPPPVSDVPRWVHAAIARGLASDPTKRFRSMTEVATLLAGPRRREWLVVGAALGVAAMTAVAIVGFRQREHADQVRFEEESCPDSMTLVTAEASTGQRAREAVVALGVPYANAAFQWLGDVLGKRELEWANRVGGKCKPPQARECIDEHRALNHAYWTRLATTDRALIDRLPFVVADLAPTDECIPSTSLLLATARADLVFGVTPAGLAAAARVANDMDYTIARVGSLVHARLSIASGHVEDGIAELEEKVIATHGPRTVEIEARLALVAAHIERAHLDDARAELARIGPLDASMSRSSKARMHTLAATLAHLRDDNAGELTELLAAARYTPIGSGEFAPWAIPIQDALARALVRAGRVEEALDATKVVVESARKLGEMHPAYGRAMTLSGVVNLAFGRVDKARTKAVGAQRVAEESVGAESLDAADVHDLFAGISVAEGDDPLAETHLAKALAIREKLAPTAEATFATKQALAKVRDRLGRR